MDLACNNGGIEPVERRFRAPDYQVLGRIVCGLARTGQFNHLRTFLDECVPPDGGIGYSFPYLARKYLLLIIKASTSHIHNSRNTGME
jgi:hypothetical protein